MASSTILRSVMGVERLIWVSTRISCGQRPERPLLLCSAEWRDFQGEQSQHLTSIELSPLCRQIETIAHGIQKVQKRVVVADFDDCGTGALMLSHRASSPSELL